MATAGNLGFPRIGAGRELKWALERHWAGTATAEDLEAVGRTLRQRHWTLQREAGIQHIPVGDFSYYDQVLDTAVMVGAVPARFGWAGGRLSPAAYFAMARGGAPAPGAAPVAALEMTKWFDTNYHYLVPELAAGQAFQLTHNHLLDQYLEARALGIEGRPVLLGPVTFLLLSKVRAGSAQPLELLPALLPVYAAILGQLRAAGAGWVQVDEPCLALDLPVAALEALTRTYQELSAAAPELRLLLATYFGGLGANLGTVCELPVAGLHIDAVRAADEVPRVLEALPDHTILSLGLVDGRNVWRTDLPAALATLEAAEARLGADRVQVAPSCSLLHVPLTVAAEMQLDPAVRSWLAFATEKLDEVASLAQATQDRPAVEGRLAAAAAAAAQRRDSAAVHDPKVVARLAAVTPADLRRARPYDERGPVQAAALGLPELPTTTIGSFPQTGELRQARARLRRGELTPEGYDAVVAAAIAAVIEFQEALGLDVLVHGEPERTDMVEFFAAQLAGFAVTTGGWVQSYGSRCVRPPIIYGDVSRPRP
ncbi:MAG TPA: 5-methyltetrahydropteroyltriglutamate--homocysteine S-methyltransferase, partial [Candidatus Dormibacteraeota bacterium]|nr:5-methyltetrahydropteroyltriglutamate--homocysteine S-methyltransferase [Candidatus Dormibacteraeota bacterium]